MELIRYFKILLKRKNILFYCLGFFILGYLAYIFIPAKVYKSDAQIMIIERDIPAQFMGSPTPVGLDVYSITSETSHEVWMNTFLEVINSSDNALKVIKTLDLKDDDTYLSSSDLMINYKFFIYFLLTDMGIYIQSPDQSKVFKLTGFSTDPEEAKNLANTYAKACINNFNMLYRKEISRTIPILENSLDTLKMKISYIEIQKKEFEAKENIVNISSQISNFISEQADLRTMYETTLRTLSENKIYMKKTLVLLKEQPEFIESAIEEEYNTMIDTYKNELTNLENQWLSLKHFKTPEHPDSKGLLENIEAFKNKISEEQLKRFGSVSKSRNIIYDQLLTNYTNRKIDDFVAKIRKNLLEKQIEYYNQKLTLLNEKEMEINSYNDDLESYRNLYTTLLRNIQSAKSIITADISNIITFQKATLSENIENDKYFPKKKLSLLIFAFMGLFSWLFMAFFMEYIEQGFCYPEEIEQHLKAPLLETFPLYKNNDIKTFSKNKDFIIRIQNLISYLIFINKSKLPRSINILSTSPSEGTSTAAIHLGLTLAKNQKKVLLIDGNLQRPVIANFFNIPLSKGISSVMLESIKTPDVIVPSGIEGLSLTSFGPLVENFSPSVEMDNLRKIFHSLDEDFDIIIVDSPAISESNNGILLSKLTNSSIFVVAAEASPIESVKRVFNRLMSTELKVAGILFNKLRK